MYMYSDYWNQYDLNYIVGKYQPMIHSATGNQLLGF